MSIEKINSNLPLSDKITQLNDMIIELYGLVWQGKFDVNEMDNVYQMYGTNRKFLRNQSLGHTIGTYTGWTHVQAEDGYSIWKYTPTRYAYNALNALYLDDKKLDFRGQALTETATAFDSVQLYNGDSGTGYVDDTTEAGTEAGTEFDLMNSTTDYLYMGNATTFGGMKFEFGTRGSNYTLKIEYYNGASWEEVTASGDSLVDDTSGFESDGAIHFTIPGDWATVAVNSITKYWIRISTTTTPVTVAKAYYIIPYNSVISLLALSSSEIHDEEWAWCSYGAVVYVTIRNAGNTDYEGDYYITSASTATNKQNFLVFNHEYVADYQDSAWISETINIQDASLGHTIDGGGATIVTGLKGSIVVPFDCTIEEWIIVADDDAGDIAIDIWKGTIVGYPTVDGDSIVGSGGGRPYLTNERTRIGTDLTGWTTTIEEDSVLSFYVDSCYNLTRANIILKVRKT